MCKQPLSAEQLDKYCHVFLIRCRPLMVALG
jgi:hypothetical protein